MPRRSRRAQPRTVLDLAGPSPRDPEHAAERQALLGLTVILLSEACAGRDTVIEDGYDHRWAVARRIVQPLACRSRLLRQLAPLFDDAAVTPLHRGRALRRCLRELCR